MRWQDDSTALHDACAGTPLTRRPHAACSLCTGSPEQGDDSAQASVTSSSRRPFRHALRVLLASLI
eukprot:6186043-Pleurochrysis_carterae.AAC.1